MIDKRALESDAAVATATAFNDAFRNSIYFPSHSDTVEYIKRIVHEACMLYGLEDSWKITIREAVRDNKSSWHVIIRIGSKIIDG